MTFASLEYLIFLPVVFLLYWLLCIKNKNLQNGLIVVASLVFYGWWDWRFLGLLLVTVLSTYFAGLLLQKLEIKKKRKAVLLAALALNIGILFFFKYFHFFMKSFMDAF